MRDRIPDAPWVENYDKYFNIHYQCIPPEDPEYDELEPEEDEEKKETPWEKFCRKADEEYDSRGDM